jgi:hypothetical protein
VPETHLIGYQVNRVQRSGLSEQAFALRNLPLAGFLIYNPSMPNPNPLVGVVPQVVHPVNDGDTTISEYVEKIEGEVALDTYVKAQTSAPEVVKRITELENSLWRLANAIMASSEVAKHPELRAAAEEAVLLLKNRLEVDDTKHRFHSELGAFKDELRITKD